MSKSKEKKSRAKLFEELCNNKDAVQLPNPAWARVLTSSNILIFAKVLSDYKFLNIAVLPNLEIAIAHGQEDLDWMHCQRPKSADDISRIIRVFDNISSN